MLNNTVVFYIFPSIWYGLSGGVCQSFAVTRIQTKIAEGAQRDPGPYERRLDWAVKNEIWALK
jgi:hypothetical protein